MSSKDMPAEPWLAIQKRALGGAIKKIESVTVANTVSYEAAVTEKNGTNKEIGVNADLTPHHD